MPRLEGIRTMSGVRAASRAKNISKFELEDGPFTETPIRSDTAGFPPTVTVCSPPFSKWMDYGGPR